MSIDARARRHRPWLRPHRLAAAGCSLAAAIAASGAPAVGALAVGAPAVGAPAGAGRVGSGGTGGPAAPAVTSSGSSIELVKQTVWVGSNGMTMQLGVTSALPTASLALQVIVYSRLITRSGFDESLTDPASGGTVLSSPTLPLSSLAAPQTYPGGVRVFKLDLPVSPGYPSSTSAQGTLSLLCPSGGQCDGVYPMQVELLDVHLARPQLAGLTTYLVYDAAESGLPVDAGIVLPVGTSPALAPTGAGALGAARLQHLEGLTGTLVQSRFAGVPLTLDVYPQLLLALARTDDARARLVLANLRAAAGEQLGGKPSRELLGAPFTPIDPTGLTAEGLGEDVASQLARGSTVLGQLVGHAVPGTYVLAGPLSRGAAAALGGAGIHDLVVPAGDVADTPADGTWTARFSLAVTSTSGASGPSGATPGGTASGATGSSAQGSLTSPAGTRAPGAGAGGSAVSGGGAVSGGQRSFPALAADPGLTSIFARSGQSPALAAYQLLAELALIYYEAPDTPTPRAVVIAPPAWAESTRFLQTLMSGLEASSGGPEPLARGATLQQLFALPAGGAGTPANEHLAAAGTRAVPHNLEALVGDARANVRALASVVPGDAGMRRSLLDEVLLAETAGMAWRQRTAYGASAGRALRGVGGRLELPGGKRVTLTSRCGNLPITIASSSPTAVHLVLRLSSSAVIVCRGSAGSEPRTVLGNTQVTLHIGTRTSGLSLLRIELVSPVGGVVLFSSEYDVLSTAASPVAVALSLGALLVLLVWWVRSSRRRRKARAATRRQRGGPGGGPGGSPGGVPDTGSAPPPGSGPGFGPDLGPAGVTA